MTTWTGDVIGHRGAAGLAPENTLEGFELAVSLGVDGVELDVRRTADGHAVVFHDATLERFVSGADPAARAPVSTLTLERLRRVDAGAPFGRPGCRIPTLREALDVLSGRTTVHVECKGAGTDGLATLESCLQELARHDGTAILSSFHGEVLARASREAPEIPRALIVGRSAAAGAAREARDLECVALHVAWSALDGRIESEAREAGLAIRAWTVNSESGMRTLIARGIEGLVTDRPDVLLGILGRSTTPLPEGA